MTKINFSKLPCYVDIRKAGKMEMDVKYNFSNALYIQGHGVAMGALAMKIYNSTGKEEYNDEECKIILTFAQSISPMLFDSLRDIINGKE